MLEAVEVFLVSLKKIVSHRVTKLRAKMLRNIRTLMRVRSKAELGKLPYR